jgi:dihydroorotase-like cyclic amidohydrolase
VRIIGVSRGERMTGAGCDLVLPGGIDMHVHLSPGEPPEPGVPGWADDFRSGSRAAIAGVVTISGLTTLFLRRRSRQDRTWPPCGRDAGPRIL